jgi:hypothetical protein
VELSFFKAIRLRFLIVRRHASLQAYAQENLREKNLGEEYTFAAFTSFLFSPPHQAFEHGWVGILWW